jgi:hypothetical protein
MALKRRRKGRKLLLATDERGREGTSERRDLRGNAEETPGRDRLRLALEHQLIDWLDQRRVLHQSEGGIAEQISPLRALCSSRAATLTASPVTSVSPAPATISPVLMPVRDSSSTP